MFYKKKENPPSNIKFSNNLSYMGDFGKRTENKRVVDNDKQDNNYNPIKKVKTEFLKINRQNVNTTSKELQDFFTILDKFFFDINKIDSESITNYVKENKEKIETEEIPEQIIEENNDTENENDDQYNKLNGYIKGITKN